MEMGARHWFHRSNIIMLLLMLLVLVTSMCGVSCLGAQQSNIANKSDSDLIAADGGNRVQNRAFASSAATKFLASLPASLARVFGRTVTGESEGFIPRTFGRIQKKLTIGLLPVMFKMGILTTVIFTILLLVAKGVFISKLLLIINLGFVLAKLVAWKSHESNNYSHGGGWQTAPHSGGGSANDIHLHIHNAGPAIYPVAAQRDLPYGAYAPRNGPNIHIDSSPSYGSGGSSGEPWGGYSTIRRQQLGDEFAYADAGTAPLQGGYYQQQQQQRPVYIPNARFN